MDGSEAAMEVVWPLGRNDYLTVCDQHPTMYQSSSAMLASLGEEDDAPLPFNPPRLNDYEIVAASPSCLRWVTLTELAAEMECGKKEVASLARHLLTAVQHGLLRRQQVPRTIRGISRMRWCYRVVDGWDPNAAIRKGLCK